MSLTTELKEYAVKQGVDVIGVSSAEAFEVEGKAVLKGYCQRVLEHWSQKPESTGYFNMTLYSSLY